VTSFPGTLHLVVVLRHYTTPVLLFHFHLSVRCSSLLVSFLLRFFLSSIPHTCIPFVSSPAICSLPQSSTGLRIFSLPIISVLYRIINYVFQFLYFSFSHFAHIDDFVYLPLLHPLVIFSPGKTYFKVTLMSTLPIPSCHLQQPYWPSPRSWDLIIAHTFSYMKPLSGIPAFVLDSWPISCPEIGKELPLLAA
jgi:hypothetical protein